MAHPWKVGDQVFYRRLGESQCSAHTITHIWADKTPPKAYLGNGDVVELTDDTLTPPPNPVSAD